MYRPNTLPQAKSRERFLTVMTCRRQPLTPLNRKLHRAVALNPVFQIFKNILMKLHLGEQKLPAKRGRHGGAELETRSKTENVERNGLFWLQRHVLSYGLTKCTSSLLARRQQIASFLILRG